jgi:hypothetical protein
VPHVGTVESGAATREAALEAAAAALAVPVDNLEIA